MGLLHCSKDKSGPSVDAGVAEFIRTLETQGNKKVVRFHSDQDAAFVKGELAARLLATKVEQTDTGGYFSSKNAITERRIGLAASTCRGLLHHATGGTKYYRPLWAAALRHATVCISVSARSDGRPAPFSLFTGMDYEFK